MRHAPRPRWSTALLVTGGVLTAASLAVGAARPLPAAHADTGTSVGSAVAASSSSRGGLHYVALGDSYASGFGVAPYSSGPAAGCAQSTTDYPPRSHRPWGSDSTIGAAPARRPATSPGCRSRPVRRRSPPPRRSLHCPRAPTSSRSRSAATTSASPTWSQLHRARPGRSAVLRHQRRELRPLQGPLLPGRARCRA